MDIFSYNKAFLNITLSLDFVIMFKLLARVNDYIYIREYYLKKNKKLYFFFYFCYIFYLMFYVSVITLSFF